MTEESIMMRWALGRSIRDMLADGRLNKPGACKSLAKDLGLTSSTMNRYRRVAEVYDERSLKALLARKMSNGGSLGWSHIIYLSNEMSDARRQELTDRVFEQSLTVTSLIDILAKSSGRATSDRSISSVKSTKSAEAGETFEVLLSLYAGVEVDVMFEALSQYAHVMHGLLNSCGAADYGDDTLQAIRDRLARAAGVAEQLRDRVRPLQQSANLKAVELLQEYDVELLKNALRTAGLTPPLGATPLQIARLVYDNLAAAEAQQEGVGNADGADPA